MGGGTEIEWGSRELLLAHLHCYYWSSVASHSCTFRNSIQHMAVIKILPYIVWV